MINFYRNAWITACYQMTRTASYAISLKNHDNKRSRMRAARIEVRQGREKRVCPY